MKMCYIGTVPKWTQAREPLPSDSEGSCRGGFFAAIFEGWMEVTGYGSSSKTVKATRTYPNLSSADATHLPKTISDGGRTMTLQNVKCQNPFQ